MRSLLRDFGLLVSAYACLWGTSWTLRSHGPMVFGVLDDGQEFHYDPGVLLGGLPPTPLPVSDAPQALAMLLGGAGFLILVIRGHAVVPQCGQFLACCVC